LEAFARGGSKKRKKKKHKWRSKKKVAVTLSGQIEKNNKPKPFFFIFGFLEDVKLIAGNWLPERNPDLF
jgi:hypothetical protein